MRIKLSYLTIDIVFTDTEEYGEWHPPNLIYIQKGLTGPSLVDTIGHELGHVGYYLYDPQDEESQVRVCSTVWTEALYRNPKLKQLVMDHL